MRGNLEATPPPSPTHVSITCSTCGFLILLDSKGAIAAAAIWDTTINVGTQTFVPRSDKRNQGLHWLVYPSVLLAKFSPDQ